MGWSTRELADLVGTSLRTVRHYHDVGLLGEPERRPNGYKSYGVAHLVRVLQIKRLTGLGLSLKQIAEMDEADENQQEALRALDAELAATIDRLQGVRDELAQIFSSEIAADLPREFGAAAVAMNFSETDRSLAFVMSGCWARPACRPSSGCSWTSRTASSIMSWKTCPPMRTNGHAPISQNECRCTLSGCMPITPEC